MTSPIRRIFHNFGLVASGQMAATGLGFIALALNTRALGPEDLGRLFLVQSTCELFSKVIAFQNWQSFIKVGAEIERRGSLSRLWAYGLGLDLTAAAIGAVMVGLLFLAAPRLVGLDPDTARLGLVYAASLVLMAKGTSVGALRLLDAYGWVVAVNILQAVLLLGSAAIFFAIDAPFSYYLVAIPLLTALCAIIMNFLGFLRVRASDTIGSRPRFDRMARRRFLGFAFGMSASSTLNVLRQRGEILIIGAILGPTAAALYGVANRLAALVARFAQAAQVSVYPEFGRMVSAGQSRDAAALAFRLSRWTATLAAVALIILAVAGGEILELLFGVEYRAAASILLLLSLATGISASVFALGPLVQITFGSWRFFILNLIAFGGFICFGALGPYLYGVDAAGTGRVAYSVLLAGLLIWQTHEMLNETPQRVK